MFFVCLFTVLFPLQPLTLCQLYQNEDENGKNHASIHFGATRFGFPKKKKLPLKRNKEYKLKLSTHAVKFIMYPVQTFRKAGIMEPRSFIY